MILGVAVPPDPTAREVGAAGKPGLVPRARNPWGCGGSNRGSGGTACYFSLRYTP